MKSTLLFVFLCVTQIHAIAQSCDCFGRKKKIAFKKSIIVCGVPAMAQSEYGTLMSEIVVRDCFKDRYLFDNREDAVSTYAIKKYEDSLNIISMQLIPADNMKKLIFTPLSCQAIKVNRRGEPIIKKESYIFKAPELTANQKEYLDNLCQQLKSRTTKPLSLYPFDEISIYGLFLGALNNYNDCYNLYINLDKYYKLDGGVAEATKEIPFEWIVEHRR